MLLVDRLKGVRCTNPWAEAERRAALSATAIDVSNLIEWMAGLDGGSIDDNVTRCVPPFGVTWIEWGFWKKDPTQWCRKPGEHRGGVLVRRSTADDGSWRVSASVGWATRPDWELPRAAQAEVDIAVDASGVPDWRHIGVSAHERVPLGVTAGEWDKEMLAALQVALLSFRFIHCSNVRLIEHEPPRWERRRATRTGVAAPIRYHTIDIRPATQLLENEGAVRENGLARALHICRGHFADYTNGAGLFGRHKVIVFVPEHVRGDPERGVVVSDYRARP